jgi:hypothetical protein
LFFLLFHFSSFSLCFLPSVCLLCFSNFVSHYVPLICSTVISLLHRNIVSLSGKEKARWIPIHEKWDKISIEVLIATSSLPGRAAALVCRREKTGQFLLSTCMYCLRRLSDRACLVEFLYWITISAEAAYNWCLSDFGGNVNPKKKLGEQYCFLQNLTVIVKWRGANAGQDWDENSNIQKIYFVLHKNVLWNYSVPCYLQHILTFQFCRGLFSFL